MKLHELLAFERDTRKRTQAGMTEIHRLSAEQKMMTGLEGRYESMREDGVDYPNESVPVHLNWREAFTRFYAAWCEEADLVRRKDVANCVARADIVVDGHVLAEGVPATHLLFLEKHLEHARTFVAKMHTLPLGTEWHSHQRGVCKTQERLTHKTEKIQEALVLLQPTERHPGQAQLITNDRIVGHWYRTAYSGGIPPGERTAVLARLGKVIAAVQTARERANSVEVPVLPSEQALLQYAFQLDAEELATVDGVD